MHSCENPVDFSQMTGWSTCKFWSEEQACLWAKVKESNTPASTIFWQTHKHSGSLHSLEVRLLLLLQLPTPHIQEINVQQQIPSQGAIENNMNFLSHIEDHIINPHNLSIFCPSMY
jgi:hypothetical protein